MKTAFKRGQKVALHLPLLCCAKQFLWIVTFSWLLLMHATVMPSESLGRVCLTDLFLRILTLSEFDFTINCGAVHFLMWTLRSQSCWFSSSDNSSQTDWLTYRLHSMYSYSCVQFGLLGNVNNKQEFPSGLEGRKKFYSRYAVCWQSCLACVTFCSDSRPFVWHMCKLCIGSC